MVEPPWKRLDAVKILPDEIEMINTEKDRMEYGWKMGGSEVLRLIMGWSEW
jgi:hypothetical protein